MIIDMHLFDCEVYYGCPQVFYTLDITQNETQHIAIGIWWVRVML